MLGIVKSKHKAKGIRIFWWPYYWLLLAGILTLILSFGFLNLKWGEWWFIKVILPRLKFDIESYYDMEYQETQ